MKKGLLLFCCAGLLGCSFVFQELNAPGFNEKLVGMGKNEVVRTLGNPEALHTVLLEDNEFEVWTYKRKKSGGVNKVGYTYYQVIFLGDNVKRWEKIRVYAHPAFEYEEPRPPSGHVPTVHFQ